MNFAQGMPNPAEPPFGQPYVPLPMGNNVVDANGAAWLHTTPAHMPWGITQPPVVRFTGEPLEMGHINYGFNHRSPPCMQFKRKIDPEPEAMPLSKLHITEEKMAAHMSQLQISSETSPREQFQYTEPEPMCAEELPKASTSIAEDENKLQRLFICDEIKRFKDEILPSAILCKLQKPSTALMLWQPPAGLLDAIKDNLGASTAARLAAEEEDRIRQNREEDMSVADNNNSTAIDLNAITSLRFDHAATTNSEDSMDL